MTRFTSFVLLVTLAGTPAVAAACAAWCLTGTFHHAASATAATAHHDEHDSARVDASHEHDESARTQQASPAAPASAAASMDDSSSMSLRVRASDHECCPAAEGTVQARHPAQRTDVSASLSISAAALTRAPSLPAFISLRRPPVLNPPGAYSPRSHAPLVLRI